MLCVITCLGWPPLGPVPGVNFLGGGRAYLIVDERPGGGNARRAATVPDQPARWRVRRQGPTRWVG
jgi:hypothetical protein